MLESKKGILTFVIFVVFVGLANAKSESGIGGGLNIGVMVAEDEDVYLGLGTDLYPELSLNLEESALRIGATAGLIWRKEETFFSSSLFGSSFEEREILIFPVMGRLDIRPLALLDSDISPFFGIGAGYYAASKGPQGQPAVALRAGIDIW